MLGWQSPEGDPQTDGFFEALDRVNALADDSSGFVWRLQDEEGGGNATSIQVTPDPLLIVNMSVWESADALFEFVYRSAHTPVMAMRRDWFARFDGAYQALWWLPAGQIPTVEDGFARLWRLDKFGPTVQAFTFKQRFPPENTLGAAGGS